VVIAVGDHYFGQVPELLLRASCPFGGGVGGCREELCGVLSGGIIMLGALRGRVSPTENDEGVRLLARQYRDWFMRRYGNSACNPIRNQMPEVDKRCRSVVEEGARELVELLDAGGKVRGDTM
jgi:C_GCAxxG_C_C family probable redox protein